MTWFVLGQILKLPLNRSEIDHVFIWNCFCDCLIIPKKSCKRPAIPKHYFHPPVAKLLHNNDSLRCALEIAALTSTVNGRKEVQPRGGWMHAENRFWTTIRPHERIPCQQWCDKEKHNTEGPQPPCSRRTKSKEKLPALTRFTVDIKIRKTWCDLRSLVLGGHHEWHVSL